MIEHDGGLPVSSTPFDFAAIDPNEAEDTNIVAKFCAAFCLNEKEAADILQWVEANDAKPTITLDQVRAVEARERMAWHILTTYQSKQAGATELRMSTRAMAFILGHYSVSGAQTAAELARKSGVSKAALGKCLLTFQNEMGLPPYPGQRSDEGRKNMKRSRSKQLKNT